MANPANYPLSIIAGDTKTVNLTLKDASGTPVNITGRTYAAQLRGTIEDASPLVTFSCAIASASAGTVTCTLSAASTGNLSAGDGVWSLRETNGSVVTTLLEGPVRISVSPTR